MHQHALADGWWKEQGHIFMLVGINGVQDLLCAQWIGQGQ